jgi:hypothetical protein
VRPADEAFKRLFRGRTDAWGAVHGESIQRELTDGDWTDHLHGVGSIGIYPLVKAPGGLRVAWGCTDIDDGYEQSLPLAKNMHQALRLLGLTSWVEVTKSKGFHVWVFVNGWALAEHMRNALLLAHQIAGVTPTEVNPKQTVAKGAGLGNYVNLCYAHNWSGDSDEILVARGLGLAGWAAGGGGFLSCPTAQGQAARSGDCAVHDGSGRRGAGEDGRGCWPARPSEAHHEALSRSRLEGTVDVVRPAERGSDGPGVGDLPVAGGTSTAAGASAVRDVAYERRPVRASDAFRRVVLDVGGQLTGVPDTPLTVEEFVAAATSTAESTERLAGVAARYRPPPPPPRVSVGTYEGAVDKTLTDKLGGLAWRIFTDGPLEGRDRSGTLMRLAHLMVEGGTLTPAESLALLEDADARWGKFIERGEPERLEEMVGRAFGKRANLAD